MVPTPPNFILLNAPGEMLSTPRAKETGIHLIDITIGMSIPNITIMIGQKTRPSASPLKNSQRPLFQTPS